MSPKRRATGGRRGAAVKRASPGRRSALRPADVRALALALPGAEEGSHMGHPDFRVRGRIFASLPPGGATVSLAVEPANLDALVAAQPRTYCAIWGGRWLGVELAKVTRPALAALIADAHALVAKKRK